LQVSAQSYVEKT